MRYLTIAAAALLVWLVQAASASAAVNCTFHPDATPPFISVNVTAAGDNVVLERDTFDDQLLVNENVCLGSGQGGGEIADNENTDTIFVNDGTGGGANVRIKDPRALAPGASPEGQFSDAEIEVELNLGGGNDSLIVDGSDGADRYTIGGNGLNTAVAGLDFDPDITVGGVDDVTVYGRDGTDTISANGGLGTGEPLAEPVTLFGDAHDDDLEGGAANDIIYGGAGTDSLEGGLGTDYLDAGAGQDTASYSHAPSGVTVALDPVQPIQQTGPTGADNLISIERIEGSPHDDRLANKIQNATLDGAGGDDLITGSTAAETLYGGSGTDRIDLGQEATVYDLVTGGLGFDTVIYSGAPKALKIDLNAGEVDPLDGVGMGDELGAVEAAEGTAFADRLIGSTQANTLDGGAGSDQVEAQAGNDTVRVRDGESDTVDCGDGTDSAVADRADQDALTACETADVLPALPAEPEPQPQPQPETPPMTPEVPPEPPRTTPDTTLSFSLSARRAQRLLRTRAILATVACAGEPCNVRAGGALGRIKLKTVTRSLAGDTRTRVKVPLSRRAIRTIRSQLALRKTPRLTLNVTAADAAGNRVVRRSSIRVK